MKRKRFIRKTAHAALALMVLLAAVVLPVPASAENGELKTVKVAVDDSNIFFNYDNSGNLISGYAYEYIQKISSYTNWDVEYLPASNFSQCLELVRSGEADLFYDVSYTEERSSWLLYPDYIMGTEEYYLFCNTDNHNLHSDDISSYKGCKVGVTVGTIEGEELRRWSEINGLDLKIIEFDSDSEKEEALKAGELDMEYEISMLIKGDFSALTRISSSDFYLVANKDRQDLIEDINTAFAKVENVHKNTLENLYDKYFARAVVNRSLSKDEDEWLMNHRTLKVGYMDNYLPFSDTDESGNPSGIVKDILPVMLNSLSIEEDLTIEYIGYQSNADMYQALTSGEIDVIFPVVDSVAFGASNNIVVTSSVASLSADLAYTGIYDEDTVKTIAVSRDNEMQEYYTRTNYPDARIVYYDDIDASLKAVKNGEVGSTILNSLRTSSLLSEEGYESINAVRLVDSFSFSFAVAKGNSALLSIFNRSIACMDDDFSFNYVLNYIGTEESNTLSAYISAHRVEFLMILSVLLIGIICAMTVIILMTKKAREKMTEANRAKTSFLFNMSHDIRTPMNAILGFTDMAKRNLDDREAVKDCLDKTEQAGNILLSLINSVLEMSRIESGKAELEERPDIVDHCFEDVKITMAGLAESKNLSLDFAVENITDRYVFADFDRCNRVFINILSNAIKYSNKGGHINAKCTQIGRKEDRGIYRFTFEDDGIGMSEEFQKHIFEEFSRENNSTSSGIQGSGLGMTVAKSFVDLMGGTIECSSKQGVGTTFTVTLPLRLQQGEKPLQTNSQTKRTEGAGDAENPEGHKGSEKFGELDFTGKRVLLVDDNEMNREIAQFILEDKKLVVEEADDGTVAVEKLKEKGPDYYDVVLMDIQMPIMNGYEATKAIRAMYPYATLPIIAVSANAFEEDRAASLASGMNAHIAKPIDREELFAIMSKFMQ